VAWQTDNADNWQAHVAGAYGVVNLAGASIFGNRWTDEYKQILRSSRIEPTRELVLAIGTADPRPAVLVQGSAVGYYGFRDDTKLDESAPAGDDFLAQLTFEWEAEARKAEPLGVRTVLVRTGIVMDDEGGALPLLKMPFMFYTGGPVMPGNQYISWVHSADEVGLLMLALENEQVSGPLNATAPEPQTNKEFSATLGNVLGTPSWLPVPEFALRLALGEFAESIVNGQRVIPARAQAMGYTFQFPTADAALRDLLKK
jgi:hypothetical protein